MKYKGNNPPEYGWQTGDISCSHVYLLPKIKKALQDWQKTNHFQKEMRLIDVGCGNGYLAKEFSRKGYEVAGCDASKQGIEHARNAIPKAHFEEMSVYDDMVDVFGEGWDVVLSSEVIEHLYEPRRFVLQVFRLLRPGGLFIVTAPYHGFLKNLILVLSGKMDDHFTALWDGGHIKFWSRKTLINLLHEAGFENEKFYGAGRVAWLWKSMIVAVQKPL